MRMLQDNIVEDPCALWHDRKVCDRGLFFLYRYIKNKKNGKYEPAVDSFVRTV
jgi:hypothetical protein